MKEFYVNVELYVKLLTPLDHPVTVFSKRTIFLPKGNDVVSTQALLPVDGLDAFAVFQNTDRANE